MSRLNLSLKLYQLDEESDIDEIRDLLQELIESELPEYECEVEITGHEGVECAECMDDPGMRKLHRIND